MSDIALRCTHLSPGRVPRPCGDPAIVEYTGDVPIGVDRPARCRRHAPPDQRRDWRPVR